MLNPDRNAAAPQAYVWDPYVRVFHWTLVVAFTVAYLAEDDLLKVHVWAGYVVGGSSGASSGRPTRASRTSFTHQPKRRDLVLFRAERHLGHSPGGGAMVVLLLVFLAATVVTGLMVYGGDQQAGPLAGMLTKANGEAMEEVHEAIANITLALVLAHVAAVVLASFVHHENLVRAMITGYKRP